jgi:hypothetical protein
MMLSISSIVEAKVEFTSLAYTLTGVLMVSCVGSQLLANWRIGYPNATQFANTSSFMVYVRNCSVEYLVSLPVKCTGIPGVW